MTMPDITTDDIQTAKKATQRLSIKRKQTHGKIDDNSVTKKVLPITCKNNK